MLLVGILWRWPTLLFSGFAGFAVILLWVSRRRGDYLYFVIPAVLGPLGEVPAILGGAWVYSKPMGVVPIWLPLAWGCAALLIKCTADNIVEGRHV
jgi:hypothetical protein